MKCGASAPPSDAWRLVENRPALFRRRRPAGARRAVKGILAHGSGQGGNGVPKPAGPRAQRPRGGAEARTLSVNL